MNSFTETLKSFLKSFEILSRSYRKIFKLLQWFFRNKHHVFISYEGIAERIGCCIKTAKRALAYFLKMGWVGWKRRAYNSNYYFMNDELISLDIDNPQTFKKQNVPIHVPQDVPVFTNSMKPEENPKEDRPIKEDFPEFLKIRSLNDAQARSFAKNFKEHDLRVALKAVMNFKDQSFCENAQRFGAVLWTTAKKVAGC